MGMRWLVALFIVLNIAYFLWGDYFSPVDQGLPQATVMNPANTTWVARNGIVCHTLGPYRTPEAAQFVYDQIKTHGYSVSARALKVLRTKEYEVYLGFYETKDEAVDISRALERFEGFSYDILTKPSKKTKNEKVYYIRFKEEFVDEARARRFLEYLRFINFDAQIRKLDGPSQVYWLEYKESANAELDVLRWSLDVGASKAQKLTRHCANNAVKDETLIDMDAVR